MDFDQKIIEKTRKNMIFHDFLAVWGLALGSFLIHINHIKKFMIHGSGSGLLVVRSVSSIWFPVPVPVFRLSSRCNIWLLGPAPVF